MTGCDFLCLAAGEVVILPKNLGRVRRRCFQEVEDSFDVVIEMRWVVFFCLFRGVRLGYYISCASPPFSIRQQIPKLKCNVLDKIHLQS